MADSKMDSFHGRSNQKKQKVLREGALTREVSSVSAPKNKSKPGCLNVNRMTRETPTRSCRKKKKKKHFATN